MTLRKSIIFLLFEAKKELFEEAKDLFRTNTNLYGNSNKKILDIGSIGYDLITFVPKIPKFGITGVGMKFKENLGGKGSNEAITVKRAGGNITFVGAIGGDRFGEFCKDYLLEENEIKYIFKECRNKSTQLASIVVDQNGKNRIIIVQGANHEMDRSLVDRHFALIEESDIILLQLEIPLDTVEYVSHGFKKTTILYPSPGYHLQETTLRKLSYIIANPKDL